MVKILQTKQKNCFYIAAVILFRTTIDYRVGVFYYGQKRLRLQSMKSVHRKKKAQLNTGRFMREKMNRTKINEREKRRENLYLVSILIKTGNMLDTSRKSVFDHEYPSPR